MVIIEAAAFTRRVVSLLSDDEYRQLQLILAIRPDIGALIRGGGGLRKVRWAIEGRGKRGGVRVIYFWAVPQDQLHLLLVYPKNERDELTPEQLKRLRSIIETEYP